jgi:hypothetical protein
MEEDLGSIAQSVFAWPIWQHFVLEPAQTSSAGSIFSFAEYLSALALLLVVMAASDFRFRYRLSLTRIDLRKVGFWSGFAIGAAILVIDVWFQNGLPIPRVLNSANNLKAALGFLFLTFVFRVISVAVIKPPSFGRMNAKHFVEVNYHFVHEGNPERLQVIAEELRRSLQAIIAFAAKKKELRDGEEEKGPSQQKYAERFLLLIADERFCKIVVEKVPTFALICVQEAQKHRGAKLPIFQFTRNVGQEFITNTHSAYYQEDSGYYSGLVGYAQPVTRTLFGSYEFVERCASDGGSPLDTDYRRFYDFDTKQMEGYARASLAFVESYLKATKGHPHPHSYALARMLDSFESSLRGVYQINGVEDYSKVQAYGRLQVTVGFIKDAIELAGAHAERPACLRTYERGPDDIFEKLAKLVFKAILAASSVTTPVWTAWSIQHNAVWSDIFGFNDSAAHRIIKLKVRRLLYKEIQRMDQYANFQGAAVLGYCLNVLGVKLMDRHKGYQREFYPLHAAVIGWTKANYGRLLADHPKVAAACLQGSVTYEADKHRLAKTYSNETQKEPVREFLELD